MLSNPSHDLVSIIVPFLNGERFLRETVASVYAQTHPHWELLLADDGSTDGSTAIAKEFASRDPARVRYLEHDGHVNLGEGAARNLGIASARGAFVSFLDADDVYLPQKLERQLAVLNDHPDVGMVCNATMYWYSWDEAQRDAPDEMRELHAADDKKYDPPHLFELYLYNRVRCPATCSVMLRREVFDRIGPFDAGFKGIFEDQAFFVKVFHREMVYVMSGCFDLYRQHAGSTCATAMAANDYHPRRPNRAERRFYEWIDDYLSPQADPDGRFRRALHQLTWPYRHPVLYRIKSWFQKSFWTSR